MIECRCFAESQLQNMVQVVTKYTGVLMNYCLHIIMYEVEDEIDDCD